MVYECDKCSSALPPSVTVCPRCGEQFDDAVPLDAEVPRADFSPVFTPSSASPTLPTTVQSSQNPLSPYVSYTPSPNTVVERPFIPSYGPVATQKKSFMGQPVIVVLACLFCFPIGLVLLWIHPTWTYKTKLLVSGVLASFVLLLVCMDFIGRQYNNPPQGKAEQAQQAKTFAVVAAQQKNEDKRKAALAKRNAAIAAQQAKAQAHQQNLAAAAKQREEQEKQNQDEEADAEATYRTKMVHNASQLGDCLTTFSSLCGEPKFYDDDWKIQMAASLIDMKQLSQEGQALSCPKRFQAVQDRYDAALSEYERVSDDMPAAIDHLDVDKMRECAIRMNHATDLVASAKTELDKLNN